MLVELFYCVRIILLPHYYLFRKSVAKLITFINIELYLFLTIHIGRKRT